MLTLNPPDHTRIRALVSRAFTPRRVEELRPVIESLLDPVLERFADQQQGDVMAELAMPFPVAVISELLGVPGEGNEHIRPWVRDVTAFIDAASDDEAIQRATLAALELVGYFSGLIEEKRAHPDDRLLSALIEVEEAGDRLSPAELIVNTLLLYAAGFETTSNLIGNGLWALLDNPDQLDRLRGDRDLLPSAMWEILRYDSPVQLNSRTVLTDVEIFGATWQRGDTFTVLQGCANRDSGRVSRSGAVRRRPVRRGGASAAQLRLGSPPLPRRPPGTGRGRDRVRRASRPVRLHRARHHRARHRRTRQGPPALPPQLHPSRPRQASRARGPVLRRLTRR